MKIMCTSKNGGAIEVRRIILHFDVFILFQWLLDDTLFTCIQIFDTFLVFYVKKQRSFNILSNFGTKNVI